MKEPANNNTSPDPPGRDPISDLALWHRFHWRLTALYAIATFLVLGVMSWQFYTRTVTSELNTVRSQLLATAITLSATIDADQADDLRLAEDREHPYYIDFTRQCGEILERYPDIASIYVLRPTEEEGIFTFIIDCTLDSTPVDIGVAYDGTDFPRMTDGLSRPAVEDQASRDVYGVFLSGYAPLVASDGHTVGVIGVDMDASRIDRIKKSVLSVTALLFGIATLVLGLAGIIVARSVRRPLSRVISATSAVAHGHFDQELEMSRKDEFGLLCVRFNQMAGGLKERDFIRETFGKYVSEDVAKSLLASKDGIELGGETREVTVLFSDLRGYSTISEHLKPSQIVDLLNTYLNGMNVLIDDHGGCVIEYLGDAILAVFGAPNELPNHPEKATRCAMAMRTRLVELNEVWKETGLAEYWTQHGLDSLNQRIGIHTGQVVAGNLGSDTRMKYAVIGDSVNVAARLEQLNKKLGTDILISEAIVRCLSDDLRSQCDDKGKHPIKGREGDIRVFTL